MSNDDGDQGFELSKWKNGVVKNRWTGHQEKKGCKWKIRSSIMNTLS